MKAMIKKVFEKALYSVSAHGGRGGIGAIGLYKDYVAATVSQYSGSCPCCRTNSSYCPSFLLFKRDALKVCLDGYGNAGWIVIRDGILASASFEHLILYDLKNDIIIKKMVSPTRAANYNKSVPVIIRPYVLWIRSNRTTTEYWGLRFTSAAISYELLKEEKGMWMKVSGGSKALKAPWGGGGELIFSSAWIVPGKKTYILVRAKKPNGTNSVLVYDQNLDLINELNDAEMPDIRKMYGDLYVDWNNKKVVVYKVGWKEVSFMDGTDVVSGKIPVIDKKVYEADYSNCVANCPTVVNAFQWGGGAGYAIRYPDGSLRAILLDTEGKEITIDLGNYRYAGKVAIDVWVDNTDDDTVVKLGMTWTRGNDTLMYSEFELDKDPSDLLPEEEEEQEEEESQTQEETQEQGQDGRSEEGQDQGGQEITLPPTPSSSQTSQTNETQDIVTKVKNFVRENPEIAVAISGLGGIAAWELVKAILSKKEQPVTTLGALGTGVANLDKLKNLLTLLGVGI